MEIETLDSSCSVADVIGHHSATAVHCIIAGVQPILTMHQYEKHYVIRSVAEKFAWIFDEATVKVKPFSVAMCHHPKIWPANPTDLIPYGV